MARAHQPGRFQIDPPGGHRLETFSGLSTRGEACNPCRTSVRARPLRHQGEGARRHQTDRIYTVMSGVFYIV